MKMKMENKTKNNDACTNFYNDLKSVDCNRWIRACKETEK
ncbi:hypothetical protein GCWU000325_01915 [Alloprevotella tannerae ATCC 51259]|uniref:Uncharacterized protein n=1 Tax=Alloprevotella tannerae ATCC 51259 TaxID=626522 RepID=C9LI57_9BACT|nr:hypothetical protein GCWU000325_01915 [Alloprevotella tannerae ATCC 51259]